uniref:Uncharacterized protein n=1 Tax=Cacopsylla melanoneura TaxID=428564 RepID=A0A8D8W659_9HEMI
MSLSAILTLYYSFLHLLHPSHSFRKYPKNMLGFLFCPFFSLLSFPILLSCYSFVFLYFPISLSPIHPRIIPPSIIFTPLFLPPLFSPPIIPASIISSSVQLQFQVFAVKSS